MTNGLMVCCEKERGGGRGAIFHTMSQASPLSPRPAIDDGRTGLGTASLASPPDVHSKKKRLEGQEVRRLSLQDLQLTRDGRQAVSILLILSQPETAWLLQRSVDERDSRQMAHC